MEKYIYLSLYAASIPALIYFVRFKRDEASRDRVRQNSFLAFFFGLKAFVFAILTGIMALVFCWADAALWALSLAWFSTAIAIYLGDRIGLFSMYRRTPRRSRISCEC